MLCWQHNLQIIYQHQQTYNNEPNPLDTCGHKRTMYFLVLLPKLSLFWKSFIQHYFQSHCCGWAPFKTYFGQFYFYHIQVKFPILMGQNFPSQPCLSTPNTLYSNSPPDIYQITSSWKYLKQLPSKMSPTFWYPHSPIIEFLHMWQGQPFWPIEQDNGISLLRFIVEYL